MSKVGKLVETLIEATEEKGISWRIPKKSERLAFEVKFRSLMGIYIIDSDDDEMVAVVKYTITDKPFAPPASDTIYTEKVSLLIFDKVNEEIITQIDDTELEESHRLWTLYKLADRSEKGADKIIDNLINKYKPFPF